MGGNLNLNWKDDNTFTSRKEALDPSTLSLSVSFCINAHQDDTVPPLYLFHMATISVIDAGARFYIVT